MIRCSHCGHDNRPGRFSGGAPARCEVCSASLAVPESGCTLPSTRVVYWKWVLGTLAAGGLLLSLAGAARYQAFRRVQSELAREAEGTLGDQDRLSPGHSEERASTAETPAEPAARAARPTDSLEPDPSIPSARGWEQEWRLRLRRDPAFAVSPLEKRLLQMQSLGKQLEVPDRRTLGEIARLAAPPGSRVEVTPEGGLHVIRVAFPMSAMSVHEQGAATKHRSVASLREEVRQISAELARDILSASGARGVRRLTVSCNRALRQTLIPEAATAEERVELLAHAKVAMRRIYRIAVEVDSRLEASDWRSISSDRIRALMKVEQDDLGQIVIEATPLPGLPPAAEGGGLLEF